LEGNRYFFSKNLLTRTASSIILVTLALYLNYKGNYIFFATIILINLILLIELYGLFDIKTPNVNFFLNFFFGLTCFSCIFFAHYNFFFIAILSGLILSFIFLPSKKLFALIPYFYFNLPLSAFLYLNNSIDGKLFIYWSFLVVWSSDIAGYVFGQLLRGPKLYYSLSPNKTWTGCLSGLLFSGLSSVLYAYYLEYGEFLKYFFLGSLGAIFSVLGDLYESKLKRINNKKDTSALIPGHGGLLDRLDGFLFAILYFYVLSAI